MILNPRTLKCISAGGRKAQELAEKGIISDAEIYQRKAQPKGLQWFWQQQPRQRPQPQQYRQTQKQRYYPPAFAAPSLQHNGCPPGTVRNNATRRCVKIGGKVYNELARGRYAAPAPQWFGRAPARDPFPAPVPDYWYPQAPAAARPRIPVLIKETPERMGRSEEPIRLPLGSAAPAPLGDRAAVLDWAASNCKNAIDPLTGTAFVSADTSALQEMIRLHDRTCTLAAPLNTRVSTEHKAGRIMSIPGDPKTPMTLDDFRALRSAMRRRDPAYRIPGRKHAPPPANWQFHVSPSPRHPEFMALAYVDANKARRTPYGTEYPPDAYLVDLGVVPATAPPGAFCSGQMIVELLERLAAANRLLVPVAGGWKPLAGLGFPFKRSFWDGATRAARISRLCKDLAKALGSPL